jgi:hypothetical protein
LPHRFRWQRHASGIVLHPHGSAIRRFHGFRLPAVPLGRFAPPSAGATMNTTGFRRRAGPTLRRSRYRPGSGKTFRSRLAFRRSSLERRIRVGFRIPGSRAPSPPERRSAPSVPPGPPSRGLSPLFRSGRPALAGERTPWRVGTAPRFRPFRASAEQETSPRLSGRDTDPVPGLRRAWPFGYAIRALSRWSSRPSTRARSGLSQQPNASVRVASR